MLEARDIRASYGACEVLGGVDFLARAGEVTAIVGPNGSGKSTLLGALTGSLPFSGSIRLNGRDTEGQKPWELAVQRAVLPQASRIAFPFTVIEVVRIGLQAGRLATRADIPMQAMARVGLAQYAERYFQDLSGGEAQRAMLARVLAQVWEPVCDGAPCWLFLDEPVASLDIGHQLVIMQIARDFAKAGGGVLVVMHDLNLTAMFADRIALMQAGQVTAFGTPCDVLTDATLSYAYGCDIRANAMPDGDIPFVLPQAARRRGA